jgi:hypothetical protein
MADSILDAVASSQSAFNDLMDKIDADNTTTMDVDYVATQSVDNDFAPDAEGSEAQHKASFRRSLRSALCHKKLADEIVDAMEELETTHNALCAKIDAEGGTLNDVDYESTLSISETDSDSAGSEAQHKASFRRSLRSALSHKRLADEVLDSIIGLQSAMNSALAQLDTDAGGATGALTGLYTPFKVTAIDPDSE